MARKQFKREGGAYLDRPLASRPLATPVIDPAPGWDEDVRGMGRSPMQSPVRKDRPLPISPRYRRLVLGNAVHVVRDQGGSLPAKRLQALYADPRVGFCLRRKKRREVLFAFRHSGKNGSGKPYRRTYQSKWSCK